MGKDRKKYIENLTGYLIDKNGYREISHKMHSTRFVDHIKLDLESGDVAKMSPTKLGEIMCSFEIGDVMATRQEIFESVRFSGDCGELLRELVSLCLAYAIRYRLCCEY